MSINFIELESLVLHAIGFDWRRGPEKTFDINGHILYMYIALGQGQTVPWGKIIFININLLHFGHLLQVFPIK